ncbi:hypothetical protein [Microbacterium sp. NPDC089696]|uniref:hypothetical protein n=1 Tax=Microbacterium sp. NPDC089696 TaxID=3364199 RepID=UPI0037F8984B
MRILTVRQPWAWAIIHGGKDVENRPRNIAGSYRGPVAIHAGLTYDKDSHERSQTLRDAQDRAAVALGAEVFSHGYLWDLDAPDPREQWSLMGHIIGVVDLVDVHSASVIGGCGRIQHDCDEHPNGCRHHCSPWAMGPAPEGWYQHLVFENPRALDEPIPYTGALGLRNLAVRSPEVVLDINRQIGATS